jgi:hypothetical protein
VAGQGAPCVFLENQIVAYRAFESGKVPQDGPLAAVKRAPLDSWGGLDYIVHKAVVVRRVKEDAMLNLFYGLESNIALQAAVLAFGCATFFGVVLCSRCPHCGWLEWVGEVFGKDDED